MFKNMTRALIIGSSMTLTFGCADENLYQFGLRGKWQLESRQLPDGTVLEPPSVSGHYEWYPTGKTTAHVTASISLGPDRILVSGYTYSFQSADMAAQSFTRREYLNIGGGYGTSPGKTHGSSDVETAGQVVTNGSRVTLEHAKGRDQVYEDISAEGFDSVFFKIRFEDGTTDTWRRFADQPGVLPK
jgi:hypothetical protein